MSLVYDSSRIRLPDDTVLSPVAAQWRRYRPLFLVTGAGRFINQINNDVPTDNVSATRVAGEVGEVGRYMYSTNTAERTGFNWDYEPYTVGSNFSIFVIAEHDAAPVVASPMITNGTVLGADESNFGVQNKSTTREIQFGHNNGTNGESKNTGLFAKDGEFSTISVQVNGTDFEACVDGQEHASSLTYTPASNTKGSLSMYYQPGGSKLSTDNKIAMCVVFDEFIPNDIMQALHKDPSSLFDVDANVFGVVEAAAATVGAGLTNSNLLNRMRLTG